MGLLFMTIRRFAHMNSFRRENMCDMCAGGTQTANPYTYKLIEPLAPGMGQGVVVRTLLKDDVYI